MENQKITVELSRLCRTCTAERSHMSPLFVRDSDVSRRLDDMLMSCTNLKILETDGFPNLICNQCVDQLKSAYRFQQRCEAANRYYERLRLKSNSDCVQTPMVCDKDPNYDYIEMLENNLIVFRCRECCQAFSTIRKLKNHKQIHSNNEIAEEKHEFLSVNQPVDFTEKENKEEHLSEMNKEEEIDGGDDKDSNSSFFKKFDNRYTKENSEMDVIPMESEIKEEELSTFIDTILQEEIEDNGKGEYNMSNICFEQSYQKDTEKLEVVAIQKEIGKESLLEVLKETDACPNNNVENSSSDNWEEDFSLSSDSDSDYFPDQMYQVNIRTKNKKHLNTRRQHRLAKKLNSPKTDCTGIFQCADCGQKLDDRKALQDHRLLHSCQVYVQRLTCFDYPKGHLRSHDSEQRLNKRDVRYHEQAHNSNTCFECDVCEKSFSCSSHLRTHKWTHNPNKHYKCDVCEKTFTCNSKLRRHEVTHNKDKPFKCDVCEKTFTCNSNLRRHKLTHNTDKPFKCDVCEKSFSYNSVLRTHKWVHNPNKCFKCDVCEKTFTCNSKLNSHKLTHNTDKPFKCDVCEKSFSYNSRLRTHKWVHNPNKCFKCDVCEKTFTCNRNLRRHKLTHNTDNPFKCDVCEKSFSCNNGLRTHKWVHNPNKRFKCDVCGTPFTYSSNLRTHKLTHNADTRFKCDICNILFTHSRTLNKHKLTHNPNKSFKCDICEKLFSCSSNLQQHKWTHNPNKSFKCDMCEKLFPCSRTLQQHKWMHNPNKRFKCDVCQKRFTYSGTLRVHKLTHIANLSNVTSARSCSNATALFNSMSERGVTS